MRGEAEYEPAPGYEDKFHIIGTGADPIWIGRKGDVPGLFNETFWTAYRSWNSFHLGLTVPDPDSWEHEAVGILEGQYRAWFAPQRAILDSLGVIAQLLGQRRR